MKLRVKEILEAINGKLIKGDLGYEVSSVSTDSRKYKENSLFIPIKGEKYDGHDFIDDALRNGAVGFIFSRNINESAFQKCKFAIEVEDTLSSLWKLAEYYRNRENFKVIGITGSSGKTTTKYFTYSIFKEFASVNYSKENFNNEIGVPLTILDTENSYDYLILELAMRGLGQIKLLSKIARPDFAVITNIGTAHIGILGSQENIAKAKAEIFEYLNPKGWALLNGDNEWCVRIYDSLNYNKLRFGFDKENDIVGEVEYYENNAKLGIKFPDGKKIKLTVPIYPQEIYHNLIASLTLFWLNFPNKIEEIGEKVELKFPPMRLSILKGVKNSVIINDTYNANPDSVLVALNFLKAYSHGKRKIAVLGDMLELGDYSLELHRQIILKALERTDLLFLYGEEMEKALASLKEKLESDRKIYCEKDFQALLEMILNEIRENDLILVKGSRGMKMENFVKYLEEKNE
ncbi:MAG: UDP-N-acetylmuramoyl-tripeptide--D-alanyl-D-alanine ligase [Dictyoglomus sp. NZ13-RE01]|nr:MAG: UDP-N-acetylmuramoyl-tripeptide--D-alanyl-D-alanine ligase [Dictyoglomus sp. NZ13-RE01]